METQYLVVWTGAITVAACPRGINGVKLVLQFKTVSGVTTTGLFASAGAALFMPPQTTGVFISAGAALCTAPPRLVC